jgi:hypothetical protein
MCAKFAETLFGEVQPSSRPVGMPNEGVIILARDIIDFLCRA